MTKNVWTFGIIGGFISTIGFVITMINPDAINMSTGMIYGYASMLLAFSLIFVAVRNYRDNYNNGIISFGKAFKIGLYITLIASTVYVLVWLVDYYYFIGDEFMKEYAEYTKNNLIAKGASQEVIAANMKEMEKWAELYKNPFINAAITYTEIIWVGLIIALIAAGILKRKPQSEQTI